jgi:hypothetical protein
VRLPEQVFRAVGRKRKTRDIKGEMICPEEPEWGPLLNLVGEEIAEEFMCMHGVVLEDGTRLRAYKHHRNRRYLHLTGDGRAFVFVEDGDGAYRPVDLAFALWLVRVMNYDDDRGGSPPRSSGYLPSGEYVEEAYPRP